MRRLALVGLVAILFGFLAPVESAVAATTHPTYPLGSARSCKAHYVETIASHKVKGKTVKYIACVYKAPKRPAKALAPTTTTFPPAPTTTVPITTTSQSATQCTGTCKFTFPSVDDSGFVSAALNGVTQGVACPDDGSYIDECDASAGQQIDDVNVTMCAGSAGVTDAALASDDFSLALANSSQASSDSVTYDSSVATAFGNYGAVAPDQCVTGDLYFDAPSSTQWNSLNYSYTSTTLLNQVVYVWRE